MAMVTIWQMASLHFTVKTLTSYWASYWLLEVMYSLVRLYKLINFTILLQAILSMEIPVILLVLWLVW